MLLRENPQPIPARQPRPSSANAAREEEQQQAWELLAQEAMDEDAYLKELAGVDDLACASSLQVVVNTTTSTVSHLGSKLPNLYELSLNNSVLECLRDLGTGFTQLRVLWVSRCGLTSLDGASGLPALRELYAAFNDVADLQALDACAELEVLDLEGNCVSDPGMVSSLAPLANLLALTLASNPVSQSPSYRHLVCNTLPALTTLDDEEVSVSDREHTERDAEDSPSSKQGAAAHTSGGDRGRLEMEGGSSSGQQQQQQQQGEGSASTFCSTTQGQAGDADHSAHSALCHAGSVVGRGETGSGQVAGSLNGGAGTDDSLSSAVLQGGGGESGVGVRGSSELDLVHEGIKRARVGMDSHEFREMEMAVLLDGQEGGCVEEGATSAATGGLGSACSSGAGVPPSSASSDSVNPSGLPSSPRHHMHRPSSASPLMPFSAGSWIRTLRASQAGSCSTSSSILLGISCDGAAHQQPLQQQHQGGLQGIGTTSRPSSARPQSRLGSSGRPASSASARPFSARIGTASAAAAMGSHNAGQRLGTGSSAPPTADGGLYWRKHRIQATQASSGGILSNGRTLSGGGPAWSLQGQDVDEQTEESGGSASASALTLGSSAIGGSLARDLRRRRKAAAGGAARMGLTHSVGLPSSGKPAWQQSGAGGLYTSEALLQELRRWKVETADRALLPEDLPEAGSPWGNAESTEEAPMVVTAQGVAENGGGHSVVVSGVGAHGADVLDLRSGCSDEGSQDIVMKDKGREGLLRSKHHQHIDRSNSSSSSSSRGPEQPSTGGRAPTRSASSAHCQPSLAHSTPNHRATATAQQQDQGHAAAGSSPRSRPSSSAHHHHHHHEQQPQQGNSNHHRTNHLAAAGSMHLQCSGSIARSDRSNSSSSRPQSSSTSSRQHRTVLAKVMRDVGSLPSRYQPDVSLCGDQSQQQLDSPSRQNRAQVTRSGSGMESIAPTDAQHLYYKSTSHSREMDISVANPRPVQRKIEQESLGLG